MAKRIDILILSLFLIFQANAGTKILIIDGGGDEKANGYRFYNDVRRSYEIAKKQGLDPVVLAKDGTWKVSQNDTENLDNLALTPKGKAHLNPKGKVTSAPTYPPIFSGAKSSKDIKNAIEAMKLQEGDQLIVQFTGHGNVSGNMSTPNYLFFNSQESWASISEAFNGVNSKIPIKIQTSTCFGGGVHILSRLLPNACTSSTVQSNEVSKATGIGNHFYYKFWGEFHKNSKRSFADLSLDAYKFDSLNAGKGSLSSFDYMAFILRKSPYSKSTKDDHRYEPIIALSPTCSQPKSSEPIDLLEKDMLSIQAQSSEFLKQLPAAFINELKSLSGSEDPNFQNYQKEINDLKASWNALTAKEKNEKRAQFEKQSSDVESKYSKALSSIYYYQKQLRNIIDSLKEFDKVATDKQKEKLLSILKCEWSLLN